MSLLLHYVELENTSRNQVGKCIYIQGSDLFVSSDDEHSNPSTPTVRTTPVSSAHIMSLTRTLIDSTRFSRTPDGGY